MSGANFNITTLTALNENSPGGVADKYISRGDPSAVDFSVGDFTTDGAVHSLGLSSIIPTEAAGKMVHLTVDVRDDATSSIYFRTKGNTNWIAASRCVVINTSSGVANSYDIFVACDDNRELEYLTPNATFVKIDVTVRGWLVPAGGRGEKYVIRSAQASYDFELGDFTLDATWRDLDLSAIVPAEAAGKLVHVRIVARITTSNGVFRLRQKGSDADLTIASLVTQVTSSWQDIAFMVPLDANRFLQYYGTSSAWASCNLIVLGWWEDA